MLGACSTTPQEPIHTVAHIDLQRYMGPWYVIASIPTSFEKNAYSAIESYSLNPDGTIAGTFTYRKGAFDGPLKEMKPHGFVLDSSNANWGMRVFGPIKAEYRISYINQDYSEVIVGRTKRDHVWIMARTPTISKAAYQHLVSEVGKLGYDTAKLEVVPQKGA